jgi:uncharacterized delta-60 repeat protein
MRPSSCLRLPLLVLAALAVDIETSPAVSGQLDTGFMDGLAGANGQVESLALQSDGRIIAAGRFTEMNGVPRGRIARLNSDGTLDGSFMNGLSGADDTIRSLALQQDGKILISGDFRFVNGSSRNGIARLNADGSLDGAFSFTNRGKGALRIRADGKILVVVNNRFDLLEADGDQIPGGFTVTKRNGGGIMHDAVFLDENRYLIGGCFDGAGGSSGLARLNGLSFVDGTFTPFPNSWPQPEVRRIEPLPDGRFLLLGAYLSQSVEPEYPRKTIARILNSDGTIDPNFVVNHMDSRSSVHCGAYQTDGKVILGGYFEPKGDQTTFHGLMRVAADGSPDPSFQSGLRVNEGESLAIAMQPDHKVLIAGGFGTVSGIPRGNIARIYGQVPDIAVECPENTELSWSPAPVVDFGPAVAGSSGVKTVVIRNQGTLELTGLTITKSPGGNPDDFIYTGVIPGTLPPGGSASINVNFTPAAAGTRTAQLVITSNDEDENPFVLNLTGSLATPLEAWRVANFGTPYPTGPAADLSDPDNDGLANLLEFATNTDPNTSSPPVGLLVKNGSTLEFTYTRRKAALSELNFVREFSATLSGTWGTTGSTVETILSDDGTLQTVRVNTPAGNTGKRFVRLRVTKR